MNARPIKPRMLVLDGDETVLRTLCELGCPWYTVLSTRSPRTLLAWLDAYKDVAVVMTEHVLRTAAGVSLLETVRSMRPTARRVLMTTYHDLSSIVHGLHSGAIQHLVQKPFSREEVLAAIVPEGVELGQEQARRASA